MNIREKLADEIVNKLFAGDWLNRPKCNDRDFDEQVRHLTSEMLETINEVLEEYSPCQEKFF